MIGRFIFVLFAAVLLTGVTEAKPPQKIIGGNSAALGEFPYIVSLRFRGQHLCGGSIIDATHVVTAAHCVAGVVTPPYTDLFVVTGTISARAGKTHAVESVLYHAQYNTVITTSPNDIAIIKLASPIQFNQYTNKINLPTSAPPSGVPAMAAGWGFTRAHSRETVDQLLKVQVTTLDPAACQQYLARTSILYTHQICTRDAPGTGICQGDSGGPLAYNGQLIGVVSYGIPCGIGYPDVYSSVYHYVDWIKQVIAM